MKRKNMTGVNKFGRNNLFYSELESRQMLASDFEVIDINDSVGADALRVGDKLVYAAVEDLDFGNELVILDTATLEKKIIDFVPGSNGSNFEIFGSTGDWLLFEAWHPDYGEALHWLDVTLDEPTIHHADAIVDDSDLITVGEKVIFSIGGIGFDTEAAMLDLSVGPSSLVVFDINGSGSSFPRDYTVAGDRVYFSAAPSNEGRELYWIDLNSPSQTANKIDLVPGNSGSFPEDFVAAQDRLFFTATSSTTGREPAWIETVGTDPTFHLLDVEPGSSSSSPDRIALLDGKIYFSATDATNGKELRILDINSLTPVLETIDINPGSANSSPNGFFESGDRILFTAFTADIGNELRWIDSSAAMPVVESLDLFAGADSASPFIIGQAGGHIFLRAELSSAIGFELVWLDMNDLTAQPGFADMNPGPADTRMHSIDFLGDNLFIVATTDDIGKELRWVDVSNPSVVNAFDVYEYYSIANGPSNLELFGNRLFFHGIREIDGAKLRWIDVSEAEPSLNTIESPYGSGSSTLQEFLVVDERIYFESHGDIYWIDSTDDQRILNKVVVVAPPNYSGLKFAGLVGDLLFFTARNGGIGTELYWIDTTENDPTVNSLDGTPGSSSSSFGEFVTFEDRLFWAGRIAGANRLFWLDTTEPNFAINSVEIDTEQSEYIPEYMIPVGSKLFFSAADAIHGLEPRWIDMSASAPSIQTVDVNPGPDGSLSGELLADAEIVDQHLFFTASQPSLGRELYWFDVDSPVETMQFIDLYPGASSSNPKQAVPLEGRVCTIASTGDSDGSDPFCFDPNEENPVATKYNTSTSVLSIEATFGSRIFFKNFLFSDSQYGQELRWIDTSLENPQTNVIDINPGPSDGLTRFRDVVTFGDRIYFSAIDPEHGSEMRWIDALSDSITVNTFDINAGEDGSGATEPVVIGDRMYLFGYDELLGNEIHWFNFLSPSPEIETIDVNPGIFGSNPGFHSSREGIQPLAVGNDIFFAANVNGFGFELVTLEQPAAIAGREVFYGGSSFDSDVEINKTPLLLGQTASFENYTSYEKGINGVIVDVFTPGSRPTLETLGNFFEFRVGNDNSFEAPGWTVAPNPIDVTILPGGGANGSDRVTIVWADNAIENEWLEIKTLANESTGLTEPDVHYWGSAIGDTGNSATDAFVNADDVSGVRNNLSGFFSVGVNNDYDMNRDGRVDATDVGIVRNNLSGFFALTLISPPAGNGSNIVGNRNSLIGSGFDVGGTRNSLSGFSMVEANNAYVFNRDSRICIANKDTKQLRQTKGLSGAIAIEKQQANRDWFFTTEDSKKEIDFDSRFGEANSAMTAFSKR